MEFCGDMSYYDYKQKSCEVCAENNFLLYIFFFSSMVPFTIILSSIIIAKFIWLPHVEKLKSMPDLSSDEEEEEIPYEEKYPIEEARDLNKDINSDLCFINDHTPDGNVFMKFNKDNEGFDFWCDKKDISYQYLETVARKYVTYFSCASFYIDREQDIKNQIEQQEKEIKEAEEASKKRAEAQEEDSDDDVFAKLKSPVEKKTKKEIKAAIHANKFKWKGKVKEFPMIKKVKTQEKKKKKMGFSDWKNYFN